MDAWMRFEEAFGRAPELSASAPGRVDLLGEHTGDNAGLVLPLALPMRARVLLARRNDGRVDVESAAFPGRQTYFLGEERRLGHWIDYVQGVTRALRHLGLPMEGFEARIVSDVPMGRGLSSSAALEVALLRGLRALFALRFGDLHLARLARWGENVVVGTSVGILDSFACHLASEHEALLLDGRNLAYRRIPLPPGAEIVLVDAGVSRAPAEALCRARREECERAALQLGVGNLRDVGRLSRVAALKPSLERRVRHVVSENARVREAAAALDAGDLAKVGNLLNASHASLRDDFEISAPSVEAIVARAQADPAVFGARLCGHGEGGAVVCLAAGDRVAGLGARLAAAGARLLVPGKGA